MTTEITPIHGGAVAAIVALMDSQRLLTLGVNRPDGWPQVTTVGYVNDGLNIYMGDAVGLSLAGRASEVRDPHLIAGINRLVAARYPDVNVYCPSGESVAVIHVAPLIIAPVAVADGRSRPQTFAIGEGIGDVAGPDGVSRLF